VAFENVALANVIELVRHNEILYVNMQQQRDEVELLAVYVGSFMF